MIIPTTMTTSHPYDYLFQNIRLYGDTYEPDVFPCLSQLLGGSPCSTMELRTTSCTLKHQKTSYSTLVTDRPPSHSSTALFFSSPKAIYDFSSSCSSSSLAPNLGPIVDIEIGERNDLTLKGYTRVNLSFRRFKTDTSSSAVAQQRYLYIKRDPTWTETPVESLAVVCLGKGEYIPPSYCVVKSTGKTRDLSQGTKKRRRTYLCMKRCMGNPIMDILLYPAGKSECLPSDFIPLLRTPCGHDAHLNLGPNGASVRLAYRQRLLSVQVIVALALNAYITTRPPAICNSISASLSSVC